MTTEPSLAAHRGASAQRPEHTLGAYELAVAQGARGLECDIRLTADGTLVCVHDRTTRRTGSRSLTVSTSSAAELSELDYGSWHPHGAPASLLTLETLLEFATSFTHHPLTLFIETKHPVRQGPAVEHALVESLSRYGLLTPPTTDSMTPSVVVMSFSVVAVRRLARLAPFLPRVYLAESTRQLLGLSARLASATILGPSIRLLRAVPSLVDTASQRGLPVYCWTVDDPDDIALCRDLGIDWIATNWPQRTRSFLDSEKGPSALPLKETNVD